jgi:large subunit ribosomal protein L24e
MVVKTEICAFSEYRIYPGHGMKFIRRDGQPVLLSSSKTRRLSILNKKKPSKLMWTQAWRRLNKKGKDEGVARKRSRKATKVQRAIQGVSIEDLKKKIQPTKPKSAATEAALKEVKERAKAAKKTSTLNKGPAGGANVPKIQRSGKNATGGAKR